MHHHVEMASIVGGDVYGTRDDAMHIRGPVGQRREGAVRNLVLFERYDEW